MPNQPQATLCYLDTSAVRGMGARLRSVTQPSVTSVLTIIELVDGLAGSQKQYQRRRANLLDMKNAHIQILWPLPEAKFYQAFPFLATILKATDNATAPLRALLTRLETCPNRDRFGAVLREPALQDLFRWIETYEKRLGQEFIEATRVSSEDLRHVFGEASQQQRARAARLGLRMDGTLSDLCRSLKSNPLNFGLTLYAVAAALAENWLEDSSETTLRMVFESYDRSIDAYIAALAYYSALKDGLGGTSGRNDGFDLAHFLYLAPGMTLVTEDLAMKDVADSIGWPAASVDGIVAGSRISMSPNRNQHTP